MISPDVSASALPSKARGGTSDCADDASWTARLADWLKYKGFLQPKAAEAASNPATAPAR